MITLVTAAIILPIFIFIFFVFPTFSLVEATRSKYLSRGKKIFWLVFIIVIWPVGSFLYSILHPGKPFMRPLAIASSIAFILTAFGAQLAFVGMIHSSVKKVEAYRLSPQTLLEKTVDPKLQ